MSNENKSEKDEDFLYKLSEELMCKKMIKAIAKKPHVFALKSWISFVLYARCDFGMLLQKVIISSGGNIPYESK